MTFHSIVTHTNDTKTVLLPLLVFQSALTAQWVSLTAGSQKQRGAAYGLMKSI